MPHDPDAPSSKQRRRAVQALMASAGLAFVTRAWPEPVSRPFGRDLRLIQPTPSVASKAFAQALRRSYPALQVQQTPSLFEPRKAPPLYVAMGPAALQQALMADLQAPLLSVFTSRQTWVESWGPLGAARTAWQSALFAEASPDAQMQLVATLFKRRVSVGVVLSDASASLERSLREAAAVRGIDLQFERASSSLELVRSLNRMSRVQAVLAVPDATLYNAESLRALLESTYRRGVPVIGFSAAAVAAGTLGTALSTVDDVATDVLELLQGLGPQPLAPLPPPGFARHWRVSFNPNVARSLGIELTDKALQLGNPALPFRS